MSVERVAVALLGAPGDGAGAQGTLATSGFDVHRHPEDRGAADVIVLDLSSFSTASEPGFTWLRRDAKELADALRAPIVMIARHDVMPADEAVRDEVRGYLAPGEIAASLAATVRAVLARHRDEERLRAREAQIRNLLQETGHAFFSVDLEGQNLETSPTELAMLGYDSEAEVVGRSSLETHWLDPAAQASFMIEILREGRLTGYRMLFKKKGGREPVWTLGSCHLERDAAGQAVKITGFYRDYTDEYAEFLYHAALSSIVRNVRRADDLPEIVCQTALRSAVARVGLFLVRDDATASLVVRYATGLLDHERARLVGASFPRDAFTPGTTPGVASPFAELCSDMDEDLLFCAVGDPDESRSYLALLGRHTPRAGGARMRGLERFLRNAANCLRTTMMLQIERLYRAIQAALRDTADGRIGVDDILKLLLQALRREVPFEGGGIYRVIPAGAKARLHASAVLGARGARLHGGPSQLASDDPIRDFLRQRGVRERNARELRVSQSAPTPSSVPSGPSVAVPIRALDGRDVGLLYATNQRETAPDARPCFAPWDSEIFGAAAEHAALVISLLAAEDRRSQLLAHVTHEIRAPVNSIRANIDVLSRLQHTPDQARRFNHLKLDADVLLDLAQKLDGLFGSPRARSSHVERVALEPMLREIVERMEPELEERGIKRDQVEFRFDALLLVVMDKVHLKQVFFNLFSNALKYAVPGRFRVRITGQLAGQGPVVRFRDWGIGVLEADQKRIFEPGERGSNIHEVQARGAGLGLAICRQIMSEYGGTISLTLLSNPTELTLQFPNPSLEEP